MKDFVAKLILPLLLLFSGSSFAQSGFDMEDLAGWLSTETILKPVLEVDDSVCQGEIVVARCANCYAEEGLYWALQGNAEIIRTTGTFIEISVLGPGSVRVALERENYWGIGRSARSIEAMSSPLLSLRESAYICEGDTLNVLPGNGFASSRWNDGLRQPPVKFMIQAFIALRLKQCRLPAR